MPVDAQTVQKIAFLARLDLTSGLTESEIPVVLEKLSKELSDIVGYMDILNEVDTKNVQPLYSPMLETPEPREDLPKAGAAPEDILNLAPDRMEDFFAVPKII